MLPFFRQQRCTNHLLITSFDFTICTYLYLFVSAHIYIAGLFSSLKLHISIVCTDQKYGPRIITDELSSSKSIDNWNEFNSVYSACRTTI